MNFIKFLLIFYFLSACFTIYMVLTAGKVDEDDENF
jgi:hypothetical protein